MRTAITLFLVFTFTQLGFSQDFAETLYQQYTTYEESAIQERRFTYSDIEPLIKQLSSESGFKVEQVGQSIEGRPINLVRMGSGDTKVLFWSQMHGDESTATMALFDLFNFFSHKDDSFLEKKERLLSELSLYFIPMLNPDGAEHFERRNALDIDINRDARRAVSPEAQVLKSVRDSLNPEFGFNLHDQSTYYTAGRSSHPATLSFLAPAYDYAQSENEVRSKAMRLIAYLNDMLQEYIPGKVAKYSDAHEPRAFGDLIQKWGTSTILIESGGYPNDPEKQYIRKLNFVTLLTAMQAIADNNFTDKTLEEYYQIPENEVALMDLLVRKAKIIKNGKAFTMDIGIRRSERTVADTNIVYHSAYISDLGDLSTSHGYDELDAAGLTALPGQVYPDTLQNEQEVSKLDFNQFLQEGYTDVIVREAPDTSFLDNIPVNVVSRENYSNEISLGAMPNLVLKNGDEVRYVVVNGFLYDVKKEKSTSISNTLVIE